jgi:hypothetical protein
MRKNNYLAIIITAKKNNNVLRKALKAIYKQTVLPQQLIIVLAETGKIIIPRNIQSRVVYSQIKNQVHQRTLGLKFLKKNIKFILQLDDKIILEKNSIKSLLDEWKNADINVAGITLNPQNYVRPKTGLFHLLTLTNSNIDGEILSSGFVNGWSEQKENKKMKWLNGGMTSWKLKFIPQIYKRKFPVLKWSVCEDLFFSYGVSKKYKLILSSKSKAKIILKNDKVSLLENFNNSFIHAKILHSFVSHNQKFSIFLFYYSIFSSSILGMIISLLKLDFAKTLRFFGRFIGSFFMYNKQEIN